MSEAIENFLLDKNACQLPHFFKELKEKKSDNLFLVTRKGFWVYTLLANKYEKMRFPKEKVYTDRYLLKATDHRFVEGKTVIIADDTLSNGFNLFRNYCILRKAGTKKIIPAVYALSTEFPRATLDEQMYGIYYDIFDVDREKKNEAEKIWKEFKEKLFCYRYLCQENISLLCIKEVQLFQETLCPFVVDLPMLVNKRSHGNILTDFFELSKKQFDRLCVKTEHWNYVQNVYRHSKANDKGVKEEKDRDFIIQCNYFEYYDKMFEGLKCEFLQNAVVKCKYIEKNGRYHVVFTPFAIVRSCRKTELWEVFLELMDGTEYAKQLNKKDSLDRYDWIGVFRAVIFALSLYIGEQFCLYLKSNGITEFGYDWDIMENNSESAFIASMRELCTQGAAMSNISSFTKCNGQNRPQETDQIKKERFSFDRAYTTLKNHISDRGKCSNDVISIENLEQILDLHYDFRDADEKRKGFTSIILMMLENSTCSNYVVVTSDTVLRGFRHGENSALLLSRTEKLCQICADVLYISLKIESYMDCVKGFLEEMQRIIFQEGKYQDERIYEDEFLQYSLMIQKIPREDIHYKMMGKRFLVKNLGGLEQKVQEEAIETVERLWQKESYGEKYE